MSISKWRKKQNKLCQTVEEEIKVKITNANPKYAKSGMQVNKWSKAARKYS